MRTFRDANGRDWTVAIDAPTIKRVRAECDGLDLMNIDGDMLKRLGADPVLVVDLLWSLVRPDAEKLSVTAEQFGRALVGDAIERAADALYGALEDFFPQGRREVWRAAIAKGKEVESAIASRALDRIAALTVDDVIRISGGGSSMSVPDAPVSTRDPA